MFLLCMLHTPETSCGLHLCYYLCGAHSVVSRSRRKLVKEISKACKTGNYEIALRQTSQETEFLFSRNELLN